MPAPPAAHYETAPAEVAFRWAGLTKMLALGLDFWWFDCHWHDLIPGVGCDPAGANPGAAPGCGGSVDYAGWGQCVPATRYSLLATRYLLLLSRSFYLLTPSLPHSSTCCHAAPHTRYVFTSIMERYNRAHRPGVRTMMLGCSSSSHLASHRTPVWWTGDNQYDALALAVAQMVDGGVQVGLTTSSAFSYFFLLATHPLLVFLSPSLLVAMQLKPYVHPDCGGHHGPGIGGGRTPHSAAAPYPGEVYVAALARSPWVVLSRLLLLAHSLTHSLLLYSFPSQLLLYLLL